MTSVLPDLLAAIIQLASDSSTVADAVGRDDEGVPYVYDELPEDVNEQMPRRVITLTEVGSTPRMSYEPTMILNVEVRAYGETKKDAMDVWRPLYSLFKNQRRTVSEGVIVNSMNCINGPFSMRDPDTKWPFILSTFAVHMGEVSV